MFLQVKGVPQFLPDQLLNKGGVALRRLYEKNFEAIVLVLKIGPGYFFFFLLERWLGEL